MDVTKETTAVLLSGLSFYFPASAVEVDSVDSVATDVTTITAVFGLSFYCSSAVTATTCSALTTAVAAAAN